ncbi:MAG TPA: glycosyltransferase family 4 protein [bacterium]|nr:glycosyltransferase family 4 protein [bacterium]
MITTGIFPPDIGGPATFIPRIASALRERGHLVTVLTLGEEAGGGGASSWPFPVLRLPRRIPLPARIPWASAKIAGAARSADAIFANGLFEETAVGALIARRPWAAKVVGDGAWERARNQGWTVQGIESFQASPPARARPHRLVQRLAVRRARRVVVPSAFLARLVAGWGVRPGRIQVIPNAVDPFSPPERSEAKRRLGLGEAVVLSVGRLVSLKRMDGLILASAGHPWELVIVGDGPERSRLEEMAAGLGGGKVRFTGALGRSALEEYYGAADVFVLNSLHEGFPHVALEAMAAGVPVIAAAAGGIPEVVTSDRSGVLVPPGDDRALRSTIAALFADPDRRARLVEGGRAVAARFSWSALLDRLLPLLEGLPRRHTGPGSEVAARV